MLLVVVVVIARLGEEDEDLNLLRVKYSGGAWRHSVESQIVLGNFATSQSARFKKMALCSLPVSRQFGSSVLILLICVVAESSFCASVALATPFAETCSESPSVARFEEPAAAAEAEVVCADVLATARANSSCDIARNLIAERIELSSSVARIACQSSWLMLRRRASASAQPTIALNRENSLFRVRYFRLATNSTVEA